ncbi:MAG: pgaC 3 [Verrucomicrobia bacterium]|jgi:cellulose synthase/poly-beta-1,6-N-acetylglucosamine synthase-like glycosyltransferase|nr:pgaC 3 [Verrucomicrobiota bacterium]
MDESSILMLCFWASSGLLGFAYGGYHVLMLVMARAGSKRGGEMVPEPFSVSCVLVVADEVTRIEDRLSNLLQNGGPMKELEVVVVTDGDRDGTTAKIKALAQSDARIKVVQVPERLGKANGLNLGVAAARNEILVFADARQMFAADTIALLVRAFADAKTGAVSGRLAVAGDASAVGQGVGAYWTMEVKLRTAEAELDSCIGCTGAVYAVRRALYQPIPVDTLLDDVVIPMQIAVNGYRVRYEPAALAHDPQELDPAREKIRKRRTLAGNFQMLFRYPGWLLPWRNRLWLQLIAHKYLRLAGPVLLVTILLTNAGLLKLPFYQAVFGLQIVFYLLALTGLLVPQLKAKLFALPAAFVFLNWMIVRGFLHYVSAPQRGAWEMVNKK